MRLTNKKISEVVGYFLGETASNVALYLKGREHTSEFKVAEEMGMDIHTARTLLYNLFDHNVVRFDRKKDRKKGWYVTYWDMMEDNIKNLYNKMQKEKMDKLKGRLEKEEGNQFYMCANACTRMDFDKAMEFNFKCPECGELMNHMDNSRTIQFIHEKIEDLQQEMAKS